MEFERTQQPELDDARGIGTVAVIDKTTSTCTVYIYSSCSLGQIKLQSASAARRHVRWDSIMPERYPRHTPTLLEASQRILQEGDKGQIVGKW